MDNDLLSPQQKKTSFHHKVITFDKLQLLRNQYPNHRIVQCHGVFDILHAGHVSYFQAARQMGDFLVVTITSDRYVNKGPGRPYFPDKIRASVLAALEHVDFVCISDFPTAVPSIEQLKPHFYVKGPDYRDKTRDVTGGIYSEESAVERYGGKLVFTEDETFSSSTLVNRFFMEWSEDQHKVIDQVKALGGLDAIEAALNKVKQQSFCVIGEPIVDTYRFCIPEAISSKSPSISASFQYEENYAGGSLAIANHLADFAKEVHLLISHGDEPYFKTLLKERLDPRVILHSVPLENIPTPRKTRYIATDKSQRMFEVTDIRSNQWSVHSADDFCNKIAALNKKVDGCVLADFGHGMFDGPVLSATNDITKFIGLNVQTNSSNYGFNTFFKHKRFSYLSLDTREVRIAYHDRHTPPLDLGQRAYEDLKSINASVAMTLGPNGSYFFPADLNKAFFSPAFTDSVIDATGAGDAYFGLTSTLIKAGTDPQIVPFVGNIFAGLKTKIIGNKNSVPKAQLLKAIGTILK